MMREHPCTAGGRNILNTAVGDDCPRTVPEWFKLRGMIWTGSGVLAMALHAADFPKKAALTTQPKPLILTRNITIACEQEAFFSKNFQRNCIPLDNAVKSAHNINVGGHFVSGEMVEISSAYFSSLISKGKNYDETRKC